MLWQEICLFTPLEIKPCCSAAGSNAPPVESLWVERLEFLTGFTPTIGKR
jgi:hypothetical protein